MKFFLETTKWPDSNTEINGTYLLDDSKTKMFAFIKAGSQSVFTFKNPIRIDTRGRTFKPVKNTFGYKIGNDEPVAKSWTVVGSRGDTYTVQEVEGVLQCSCSGFKFRGTCKHIKEAK
jgi:hypothetical protein